ncbi:carboxypeptidase regulatory-like domain-containing protein [Haloparvum sp. PAK95]|uniref:carboxypeptidase regulatory-like domain-containing protein n=1 Tax=Haloparvum sp. PAK95 TaxID=3418962 RepID=UPI003D2EFC39
MTADDVVVTVNGSQVGTIDSVTAENGGEVLNVSFASGDQPVLTGDETVAVNTTGNNITNPSTAGTYEASVELYNRTEFASGTTSFEVVSGEFTGTVFNASDGSVLDGATVYVLNGSEFVTSTTTNGTGEYALELAPGTYDVVIDRKHYESEYFPDLEINASETKEINASLDPTGTLNGTVTNASDGSQISGANVSIKNSTSGAFYRNTTDNNGDYNETVAAGTYEVVVDADGYVSNTTTNVSVGVNETATFDVELTPAATLNGTVVNESDGTPIEGVSVLAIDPDDGSIVTSSETGSAGEYQLDVPPGTYDVVATDPKSRYEDSFEVDVDVSGEGAQLDLAMAEAPETGTITGRVVDDDGNGVANARVEAIDSTYTYFNSTTTEEDGTFTLKVPAGTYEVSADAEGYAEGIDTNVTVDGNADTTAAIELAEPAYINGTVTNASGPVERAFVVAEGDGRMLYDVTDSDGNYNVTVPPGNYSVTVFEQGATASTEFVDLTAGDRSQADFELKATEVTHSSVETSNSGVDTANLSMTADVRAGMMHVQLLNESSSTPRGYPNDLEGLGVDRDTEFVINITVTNYTPNSLLWGARGVEWETTQNETNQNATDITIRTKAVNLQAITNKSTPVGPLMTQDPSEVQWPSGADDRADLGWNRTVYFGLFDMSTAPKEVRDRFDGMTVTTNAQTFSPPRIENGSLRVWVAGPGTTVNGNQNDGFYRAFIPDAQLNEWNIDDPETELTARYKGEKSDFSVNETSEGAWIELKNLSYSAGVVEVVADPKESTTDSTDDSTTDDSTTTSDDSSTDDSSTDDDSADTTDETTDDTTEPDQNTGFVETDPAEAAYTRIEQRPVVTTDNRSVVEFTAETAVDTIVFEDDVGGNVTVRERTEPSESLESPALLALEIEVPEEERESPATIQLAVDSSRLDEANTEPEELVLAHHSNGEWTTLETEVVEVTDEEVVLEAETPGFSEFAVTVDETTTEETATETASETATATSTETTTQTATETGTATQSEGSTPGFGPALTLLAIVSTAMLTRRR